MGWVGKSPDNISEQLPTTKIGLKGVQKMSTRGEKNFT